MTNPIYRYAAAALLITFPVLAQAKSVHPDLTAPGVIAALKVDPEAYPRSDRSWCGGRESKFLAVQPNLKKTVK